MNNASPVGRRTEPKAAARPLSAHGRFAAAATRLSYLYNLLIGHTHPIDEARTPRTADTELFLMREHSHTSPSCTQAAACR